MVMFRRIFKLNTIGVILTALLISASIIFCLPAPHAVALTTENLRPTTYTFSAGGTNTYPQRAYDTNLNNYNTLGVSNNNADPTIEYHTWQTSSQTHSERRLYVRRRGLNNGSGGTADTWSISYSTDGGNNYIIIESGLTNPSLGYTSVVYIVTDLDLSQLVVKIATFQVGTPNNGTARIYDVRLECDYSGVPLVGTQIGAEYPIVVNPSPMTPQQQWTTITVPVAHAETIDEVDSVVVKIFYDSAGSDPDESGFSPDAQTCATFSWTRGSWPVWNIWAFEPSGTTWALNTSGCSRPSDSSTQGNWVFSIQVGKVATCSTTDGSDWDVYAIATDSAYATGSDYLRDVEMNWYGEVSTSTITVTWSGITPGSDFSDSTKQTDVIVTYIANGPYYQKIAASTPWAGSGANALLNTDGTPGGMEFSLKADDVDNLGSAVLVTAYPSYITICAGTQTSELGDEVSTNTIWLKLGAIIETTYSGTIYYLISGTA